jgi:ankyrin repeat protein
MASRSGNIGCVTVLLSNGVALDKIDRNGATALWYACFRGYLEIVKLLVQRGADTNIKLWSQLPRYQKFNGFSPCDAALWNRRAKILEYMNQRELNWRRRYFYARLLHSIKDAPTLNMAIRVLQCDDVARVIGSYL